MKFDNVRYEKVGETAQITLSATGKSNAMSDAMVGELDACLDRAFGEVRLIMLLGEGRHFCTGFDLSGLEAESDGDLLLRFVRVERLLRRIHDAPVATAAIGKGSVFGAGADLFAACDHRIAVEGTRFAFPGAGFGIVLGTARLAGLVGRDRARRIVTDGEVMDAECALDAGLVTRRVREDEVEAIGGSLARKASRLDASTVAALRRATATGNADAELAALCRSASEPGLRGRILAYRALVKAKAETSQKT